MKKLSIFVSLAVMTASVFGMPLGEVRSVDKNGNTRFMAAIVKNDNNEIRSCYNSGDVNVNHQNKDGNNAVMLALIHDNPELAKKLLSRVQNDGIQQLLTVYKNKIPLSKEQVKQIHSWSHINDTNKQGQTLLHIAANYGKFDVVDYLLGRGAVADELKFKKFSGKCICFIASFISISLYSSTK